MTEKVPRPIDMGSHLTSVYISSISLLTQSYILGPTITSLVGPAFYKELAQRCRLNSSESGNQSY